MTDVDVVRRDRDIAKNGNEPVLDYRVYGRGKTGGDGDHFIARLEPPTTQSGRGQSRERQQIGARSGICQERESRAGKTGQFPLELFGVAARGEPEIERSIHQVCKLIVIEHFSRDGNGLNAWLERLFGPVGRVVLARQRQDAAAEFVRRHATLTRVAMSPSWRSTLGRQPSSAPAREASATR